MNKKKPTMLMIMDGYGIAPDGPGNAVSCAEKPALDQIFKKYPGTTVKACGLDVGLPEGQMGNSEVGHLNIGAGRIVYQDLTKITREIESGSFFKNQELNIAMDNAKKNGTALHLQGLLSDGGVHSHISHLFALMDMAAEKNIEKLYLHCFLDGRDVPPDCAMVYFDQLNDHIKKIGLGMIATISGRYYAMDRDKRWDRLEKAYRAMTEGIGEKAADASQTIADSYGRKEYDEFVLPTVIDPEGTVKDGDSVIMFNFRPDRARELTRAFVDPDFDGFDRKKTVTDLTYVCMTQYDSEMPNVHVAYPPEHYKNTLGEYLASKGLKQLRIAETEKYAHVTFFFNGGVEEPNRNEERILIPSPKVATYDMQPEMSAPTVTNEVLKQIGSEQFDVIILNFANADMVGHTGNMEAAEKAVETLDKCIPQIVSSVLKRGGQILLTADHGNADTMKDEHGAMITAHSLNPVPLINISNDPAPLKDGGRLCDIAPTLLDMMGMEIPPEMTGHSLLKK